MAVSEEFDLFIHREGDTPRPVRASTSERLAEVLKRVDSALGPDVLVFVGESDHARGDDREEDGGEDGHQPADPTLAVAALGLHRGGHVHCHRCRRVAVAVNYGGRTKRHKFSPAATVATATDWAKKKFKLTDTDALMYVLQVCDSNSRPRPNVHLGELVHFPACDLCFDLVPENPKVEG
jgi:hypothetical protein